MLLFVDESGHDHGAMPCEVLAGAAIAEDQLWNLVNAIRSAERECFGDSLRNLRATEVKAKYLLKRKRFKSADRPLSIPESDLPGLAFVALTKGIESRGKAESHATERELVAYSRAVLHYVQLVFDLSTQHGVKIIAAVVDRDAPRPPSGLLRKDYVYLFQRYFYLLAELPPRERGLVVFDELEKAQAHILVQQMTEYFLRSEKGKFRSSRIVPEPFFVHSELTTGVFVADLATYILGWGWRLGKMRQPARPELKPYADMLHQMQFRGDEPDDQGEATRPLFGIVYLDDLRGLQQKK